MPVCQCLFGGEVGARLNFVASKRTSARKKARCTGRLIVAISRPVWHGGMRTELVLPPAVRYTQPGSLNEEIQVLQLKVPLDRRYSLVYQKVQSLLGSTCIAL